MAPAQLCTQCATQSASSGKTSANWIIRNRFGGRIRGRTRRSIASTASQRSPRRNRPASPGARPPGCACRCPVEADQRRVDRPGGLLAGGFDQARMSPSSRSASVDRTGRRREGGRTAPSDLPGLGHRRLPERWAWPTVVPADCRRPVDFPMDLTTTGRDGDPDPGRLRRARGLPAGPAYPPGRTVPEPARLAARSAR